MAQSRMTLKYTSYGKIEDTPIYEILSYFTKPRKNVVIRLDYDKENELGWDEEDIFMPSMEISKLEVVTDEKKKYSKEYFATFMCDNKYQKDLLKLFFVISQHGDPGHTFGILFNDEHTGWDGDGSDRIDEINFMEDWKKKEFYEHPNKLPEKILNYHKARHELSDKLMNTPQDSPLWDDKTRVKIAEKIAKEYSELQYQKFLEIKQKCSINNRNH